MKSLILCLILVAGAVPSYASICTAANDDLSLAAVRKKVRNCISLARTELRTNRRELYSQNKLVEAKEVSIQLKQLELESTRLDLEVLKSFERPSK